jgi:signal transduction histidine kinase
MLRSSSLKTRILVITAIPLCALLVGFLALTLHTADRAVRASVSASLSDAGSVFVKLLATRRNELLAMASVTARDPRFFATLCIPEEERGPEFAPTLRGVALDFLRITEADFIEVFDGEGRPICYVDREALASGGSPRLGRGGIEAALRGTPVTDFYLAHEHLVVAGIVPVFVSQRIEAVLRVGSFFDRQFVTEVKRLTGAEVCLTHHGAEIASTYPHPPAQAAGWDAAAPVHVALGQESFAMSDAYTAAHGGVEYLTVRVRASGVDPDDGFDAYLGRELRAELAPMIQLTQVLAWVGLLAIGATLLAAWMVAVRITGPLSSIVTAAHELERGNYAVPVEARGSDEITFLARSFDEMRLSLQKHMEHLRNLDQMKSNFIALAGHELKTPLTVISGFNEMIGSGMMGAVPEKVRETTELIQRRLVGLNRLVEDILDMSRFEQGMCEFEFTQVDLCSLAAQVLERRRGDLEGRELLLETELPAAPCWVRADPRRLAQAASHLIDNAVRFTPDGGRVTVSVCGTEGGFRIQVRDTGIGIPASEVDWIFDKVYEVGDVLNHSSGRLRFGSHGLGLGLALAKAIVEGHHGTLRVQSALGAGSEFSIELPAVRRQDVAEPAAVLVAG